MLFDGNPDGLSGSPAFNQAMNELGFGQQGIQNPRNLSSLAPNYTFTYAGFVDIAAAANSKGTIAIRTETQGFAFLVSQHFALALATVGGAAQDLNAITVNLSTVERNWTNVPVPVSMVVASANNPNGPRFMRDYIRPGDVLTIEATNNTGVALRFWYGLTGTRFQR